MLVTGLTVSLLGSFVLDRRLPPKQPGLRHTEPGVWGVTRKDVYLMHNWILAIQITGIGSLAGFTLFCRDLKILNRDGAFLQQLKRAGTSDH